MQSGAVPIMSCLTVTFRQNPKLLWGKSCFWGCFRQGRAAWSECSGYSSVSPAKSLVTQCVSEAAVLVEGTQGPSGVLQLPSLATLGAERVLGKGGTFT
jgi:hypothetical protein